MHYILKGVTYSYNRNIGWQDRTIRSIIGLMALAGAECFLQTNWLYSTLLMLLAVAQVGTVFSARGIICYFAGKCSIGSRE